ncbi:hypothetical protein GGP84_003044 [Salinibacter ruber]|uniref:ABC transporter permease n=1 Tax=Salinibacter ruber TaxID=146919 RepID=UPI00216AB162|nr:ABC transporter permease [Salinibacter ruber]MCS3940392.1 hypothetical protein [Salinibacter ruber]
MSSALRAWLHTALSDLRTRLRDRRLLMMVAACVYLGHLVLAGRIELTLVDRSYRGAANAAWMGTVLSLTAAFLLTLFGFYLVRGALSRERQGRTAPLVAASPVRSVTYLLGKWTSGTLFLLVLAGSMAVSLAVLFVLRGEGLPAPAPLLTPFLLFVVPTAAVVTAVALAFECLPGLGGTVGGILYFFGAVAATVAPVLGAAPVDLLGMGVIHDSMSQAVLAQYPEADPGAMFSFGYYRAPAEQLKTVQWDGVAVTADLLARRAGLVLAGGALAAGAALPFDRFDPSPSWRATLRSALPGPNTSTPKTEATSTEPPATAGPPTAGHPSGPEGRPDAPAPAESAPWSLLGSLSAPVALRPFGLFAVECRRALRRRSGTWQVGALVLVGAGLWIPGSTGLLVVAWLWPLPLWSDLGARETATRTAPLVASSPYPRAQRVAAWAVGAAVPLALLAGPLLLGGHWRALVGVLFVPALGLAAGRLSGTPRLFEIVYLVLWYVGLASRQAALDFGGVAHALPGTLVGYGLAAAVLLVGAVTAPHTA